METIIDLDYVDGAMCLWEEIQNCITADKLPPYLQQRLDDEGCASFRCWVAKDLTPILLSCYEKAVKKGFDDPFDWEFVPWFVYFFEDGEQGEHLIVQRIMRRREK